MKHKFFIYSILILSIIRCAKPVTPTGGARDITPPIIIETNIPTKSIRVKPNKISFQFDENIQIKSPEKIINISPILNFKVEYRKHSKGLDILLDTALLENNTTYTVQLNTSISDLNEGNEGHYESFTFSTGKTIDSNVIKTYIVNYASLNKPNLKSNYHNNATPTTAYSSKPNNANFTFEGIPNGTGYLVTFNDDNNNNTADATEDISYKIIQTPATDSIPLYLYSRKRNIIKTIAHSSNYYVYGIPRAKLNQVPQYLRVGDTLILTEAEKEEYLNNLDSSLFIISKIVDKHNDYVSFIAQDMHIDSNHIIQILSNQQNINIQKDSIFVIYTSGKKYPYSGTVLYASNIAEISLADSATKLIIQANAVQSGTMNNKNAIVHSLQQKCKLSIRNPFDNLVVGEIASSDKKYAVSIPAQSTLTIYVPQGTYKSYFFKDMDYNSMITTPIVAEAYEGEYVIWLPEIITKPNLYNEVILK